MEVDYDKNIVFELAYPTGYYTYRATKSEWDFDVNLIKADTNLDNIVNVIDIIYFINYIYLVLRIILYLIYINSI